MKGTENDWRERTDLRRALEASEARFRAIVDRSADGVIVVGVEGGIRFVNAAAEYLLARPQEKLLGELFGIPIVPGNVTEIDIFAAGSPPRIAEMRVTETSWQDEPAYLATLRDITERKRREEETREAVRRRDHFLAVLSHELRNPLSAILTASQILKSRQNNDFKAIKAREVIEQEGEQMSRLLNDLLDVSRVAQGKIELKKEHLDVGTVIADVFRVLAPAIRAQAIRFKMHKPRGPLFVHGDRARMRQVFVNLLSNALRYTAAGGSILVRASRVDGRIVVAVEDTGVGIAADKLKEIFEPFAQADTTLSRSEGGLGIGLTLVEQLVALHGGTVSATSPGEGQGSVFTVELPAAPPPDDAPQRPCRESAPRCPLRVLIVEDNANNREMLQALLEMEGHEVATAEDGARGLELIEFQKPDVALVDIGLPEIDGYEVARRVRANGAIRDVYLVALTGYGLPDDRRRSQESGFDDHLVKPVNLDTLNRLLAQRSRARDEASQPPPPASPESPQQEGPGLQGEETEEREGRGGSARGGFEKPPRRLLSDR